MMRKLIPLAILFFIGILYALTMPSGLTWAYNSADGGDFLSAIATHGVPHPSGYPTYLFFFQLFSKVPFGSLALLGNIFSLLAMLAAISFLYQLVLFLSDDVFSASISSLLFATFPLVWSQAIITEVYALQTLLFILVLYFFFKKAHFEGGISMGLLLGNHLTGVLILPILFLYTILSKKKNKITFSFTIFRQYLIGFFIGMSVYLLIPLKARRLPPVNWVRVLNWNDFWWLVSGAMYQDRLTHISDSYLLAGVRLWSSFLINELGIIGLFLGLFALIYLFKPTKLYFISVWITLTYSVFSIVYYSPDSYIYLIPLLLSFAIWIGKSSRYFLDKISKTPQIKSIAIIAMLITIIGRAILLMPEMNISTDNRAEEYAQEILTSAPKEAIIIVDSDEGLFSLWYFHFAEEMRPDVAIISEGLFSQDWYRETLRDTYPDLKISDSAWVDTLVNENPQRISCFLPNSLEPEIDCVN